jgi:hypothetical protein
MKHKNNLILSFITILMLLGVTGCFSPSVSYIDFRSGSEGLKLEIKGPNEIVLYPGSTSEYEEFEFIIRNRGSTNIENNDIYMRVQLTNNFLAERNSQKNNIVLSSLDSFNNQKITTLNGKGRFNRQGDYISYFMNIDAFPGPHEYTSATIKADLCYRYKTILATTICVNTQKHRQGEGCSKKDYSFSNGQGAPILISNLEVKETQGNEDSVELRLIFTVENREGDIVSTSGKFTEGCLLQQDINTVGLIEAKLGSLDLKCNEGNNFLELIDNKRTVICTIEEGLPNIGQGYYDAPLYIELSYGYHTSASKTITLIRKQY